MAWTIEFARRAEKQFEKLDRSTARRIRDFLEHRVAPLDNPRELGKPLHGPALGELWRYRVGDHRVVCRIEHESLIILVVAVGNRDTIYR